MLYLHGRLAADLTATPTGLRGDVAEVRRDLHALAERVARIEGAMNPWRPPANGTPAPDDQLASRKGRVSGATPRSTSAHVSRRGRRFIRSKGDESVMANGLYRLHGLYSVVLGDT